MNLLSRSERYVYVKAAIPRPLFESLVEWFGGENIALKNLRLDFEQALAERRGELQRPKIERVL